MKVGKDRGRRKASRSVAVENEVLVGLSPRQREIALLVGKGCRNKEIAAQLNITERTVKAHVGEIFRRGRIPDRLQLIVLFQRNPTT
jgi:DNA-binding NarL/FixJ family response regulator